MGELEIRYGVTASGHRVAEALVRDAAQARELIETATGAGYALIWAHSDVDLSPLGFRLNPGSRRMAGPGRTLPMPADVTPLTAAEDTAELCAAAYRDQWGHKTPDSWPIPDFAGSRVFGLRRAGQIAGTCRIVADRLIDAPGLLPGFRDVPGYRSLLTAALSVLGAGGDVMLESWGDGADRVVVCEELGLVTVAHHGGWELML